MDDYTDRFNTSLSPEQEAQFQQWLRTVSAARGRDVSRDLFDYDLRGYWRDGGHADTSGQGHMTDRYKKPNHPTFSRESQYSDRSKYQGGTWQENVFTPGRTNLEHRSAPELDQYFRRAEPEGAIRYASSEDKLAQRLSPKDLQQEARRRAVQRLKQQR